MRAVKVKQIKQLAKKLGRTDKHSLRILKKAYKRGELPLK
jgi:hypothetical protein